MTRTFSVALLIAYPLAALHNTLSLSPSQFEGTPASVKHGKTQKETGSEMYAFKSLSSHRAPLIKLPIKSVSDMRYRPTIAH